MNEVATLGAGRGAMPAPLGGGGSGATAATLRRLGVPEALRGQPALRRALPWLAALVAAALAIAAWMALSAPPRAALLPGMAEADKAAAIEMLRGAGLDVALNGQTGAVEVAPAEVARARMLLAQAGLPKAVPSGYDLLADMPMGASRALERARVKQAQERELARSVESITGVTAARVLLALPEPTPFVRETAPPAASVFVTLAPGRALGEAQVRAVQQLVASGVPGLASERVAVVDGSGALLSADPDGGPAGESGRQLAHKARLERAYLARVTALLTPVLGAANYAAQVNLDVDFTDSQQTSERFSPQTSAPRSEQTSSRADQSEPARGIPGALANTAPPTPTVAAQPPPGTPAAGAVPPALGPPAAGPRSNEENRTVNWEVGREVAVTKPAIGQIERISVAVVVRAGTPVAGGSAAPSPPALERLIATAVGLDAARGDRVSVVRQPFAATPEAPLPPLWREMASAHAGHGVALLAILAALLAVRMFTRRGKPAPAAAEPAAATTIAAPSPDAPGAAGGEADAATPGEALTPGETDTAGAPLDPQLADQMAQHRPRVARTAEILSAANSYDDKIAAIRIFVGEDAARASSVLKQLLRQPAGASA